MMYDALKLYVCLNGSPPTRTNSIVRDRLVLSVARQCRVRGDSPPPARALATPTLLARRRGARLHQSLNTDDGGDWGARACSSLQVFCVI